MTQPIVIFFGLPGSGKGTQSAILSAALSIPAISTGEMLRAESASGSDLGKSLQAILASGRLADDNLMNTALAARVRRPDCREGFILDGYPRTIPQARFLDALLNTLGLPAPTVVHLETTPQDVASRLTRRLQCPSCGKIFAGASDFCDSDGAKLTVRSDDNPHSVAERIRIYEANAGPVIDYYRARGNYHRAQAEKPPAQIASEILSLLQPAFNAAAPPTERSPRTTPAYA